eukprot:jgi/Psemu1/283542/fgenesh1_pg.29_\
MNPPEQARALKEIYQARQELVRQNEAEMADLKHRLKQATKKHQHLVAQRNAAKTNYDEAKSKIVELLDDDGDDGVVVDDDDDRKCTRDKRNRSNIKQVRKEKDQQIENPIEHRRNRTAIYSEQKPVASRSSPPVKHEVLDLVESDGSDEEKKDHTGGLSSMNEQEKYSTLESFIGEKETSDGGTRNNENPKKKRPRSSSMNRCSSYEDRNVAAKPVDDFLAESNSSAEERPRLLSTHSTGSTSSNRSKRQNNVISQPEENTPKNASSSNEENQKTSAKGRPRSSSTGSGDYPEKAGSKKRSKSTAFTRKITHRYRPNDIPLECWLKSSIGRTREELNAIDDIVHFMGSCRFAQSVVCSKFGTVHAIILNDEFNSLAQRNDELQTWYVGVGPGRKREAMLVGASRSTIPIFHAPKIEYTTRELFYVGHYKVKHIEELDPPIVKKEIECDMRVTFAFDRFDKRLDSIIKRGPKSSYNSIPEKVTG